jgi:hypothetical protein
MTSYIYSLFISELASQTFIKTNECNGMWFVYMYLCYFFAKILLGSSILCASLYIYIYVCIYIYTHTHIYIPIYSEAQLEWWFPPRTNSCFSLFVYTASNPTLRVNINLSYEKPNITAWIMAYFVALVYEVCGLCHVPCHYKFHRI